LFEVAPCYYRRFGLRRVEFEKTDVVASLKSSRTFDAELHATRIPCGDYFLQHEYVTTRCIRSRKKKKSLCCATC